WRQRQPAAFLRLGAGESSALYRRDQRRDAESLREACARAGGSRAGPGGRQQPIDRPTRRAKMQAAIFHGVGDIRATADVSRPEPGPGEVIVQVASCGICGSDLHIYRLETPSALEMHAGTLRTDPEGN